MADHDFGCSSAAGFVGIVTSNGRWYRGRLPTFQRLGLLFGAIGLLLPPNIMLAGMPSYYFCLAGLVLSSVFIMQRRIQTVGYSV